MISFSFSFCIFRDADALKSVTRVNHLKDLGVLISSFVLLFYFPSVAVHSDSCWLNSEPCSVLASIGLIFLVIVS